MLEETKIVYYIGDEKTPYVRKINVSPQAITLGDFKAAVEKPNYKFFFRSNDQDFGVVKEEINNDESHLPVSENRIVAWLVPPDVDAGSQNSVSTSQNNLMHLHHQQPMSNGIGMGNGLETESIASSRKGKYAPGRLPRYNRHMMYDQYGSQSTLMSSDLCSTTSWDSGDTTSEYSTCTEMTASSRHGRPKRHRYKKKKPQHGSDTTSVYSSSITDSSLSLNILGVTLNMEKHNFLGISIVGQSNDKGDGGIYIGSIMKGGAVAADGRIEPGDMLLQVNQVNFENMSNEDAVRELRNIVHKPGPITLTVAKCWDPSPESNYFSIPEDEPIRPIDPATWATHINAVQGNLQGSTPPYITASSDTLSSSLPESERYEQPLSIHTDMAVVMKSLKAPKSGIEVKTRMWLKITIPDAFIGSDLVDWLNQKVEGLGERRNARKYASSLLKVGYIRHTVNKATFSEQCYYVFGDYTGNNLHQGMAALSLGDSNSDRDSDTLGPLPTHGGSTSWGMAPGASNHGYPSFPQYNPYPQAPGLTVGPKVGIDGAANLAVGHPCPPSHPGHQSDADTVSLHSAHGLAHRSTSQSSLPHQLSSFGGSGGSGSDQASESRFSVRSSRSGAGFSAEKPRSTSGSERSATISRPGLQVQQPRIPFEGPLPPHPSQRPSSRNQHLRPHNLASQGMGHNYHTSQQTAESDCDSFIHLT